MLSVIWSFTFLILPTALLIAGLGTFFGVRHLLKRRAAKKALQAQNQGSSKKSRRKRNKKENTRFRVPNEQTNQQQPQPTPAPEQAQSQETSANEETEQQPQEQSPAQYLKSLNNNFRYQATDYDIVKNSKENYAKWLSLQKSLLSAKNDDRAKIKEQIEDLDRQFVDDCGHTPNIPSNADFCVSVQDENGQLIKDNRNYCYNGLGSENFKSACEDYNPTVEETEPAIFQLNMENKDIFTVSATTKDRFFAGLKDIENAYNKAGTQSAKAYLVYGEGENRKLHLQDIKSLDDIKSFISSTTKPAEPEAEQSL